MFKKKKEAVSSEKPKKKETVKKTQQKNKKKKKTMIPQSITDSIPYLNVYDNGIIETKECVFTKSYEMHDTNFKTASRDDQIRITQEFASFLGSFGEDVEIETTLYNKTIDIEHFKEEVLMPMQADSLNEYREEFNDMLIEKMSGSKNNLTTKKLLTVAVKAPNIKEAISKFSTIDESVSSLLGQITKTKTVPLCSIARLEILRNIYNQDDISPLYQKKVIDGKESESFTLQSLAKQGITTKELIAPSMLSYTTKDGQVGDYYVRSFCITNYPTWMKATVLTDFASLAANMLVSAYFHLIPQDEAMNLVKNQSTNITSKIGDRAKNSRLFDPNLIAPTLKNARESADRLREILTKEDGRLFTTNVVITIFAHSREELEVYKQQLRMISNQNLIQLDDIYWQQEIAFNSALPLANNQMDFNRLLSSSAVSALNPFDVMNYNQKDGFYYGMNPINKNMILYNRNSILNPNGCILGMPGAGKSFISKKEMVQVILNTNDEIYVIDPEREYVPLSNELGGTVVKMANGSNIHINPFDMNLENVGDDGGDPVKTKVDFITTICEIAIGGKYGLSPVEETLISRCVIQIYEEYVEYLHRRNLSIDYEKAPTMKDFYEKLLVQPEREATDIALALERFVNGSHDVFSFRTNVNIQNRFTVFDIKEIGTGLKEMALQIALDFIWNKMIENKEKGKRTWIYVDEFHFLMNKESSADYISQIWKRARKWNGVPTAITQNVEDMLKSEQARAIINNSPFLILLGQSAMNKEQLSKLLNISPAEQKYIAANKPGMGLLRINEDIIPMDDTFPHDTKLYHVMTTKPDETI